MACGAIVIVYAIWWGIVRKESKSLGCSYLCGDHHSGDQTGPNLNGSFRDRGRLIDGQHKQPVAYVMGGGVGIGSSMHAHGWVVVMYYKVSTLWYFSSL